MEGFVGIKVLLDAEKEWPDLREKLLDGRATWLNGDNVISFGVLPGGMKSGKPSVAIRIDFPDGHVAVAETSWRLLRFAVDAISARYGSGGD